MCDLSGSPPKLIFIEVLKKELVSSPICFKEHTRACTVPKARSGWTVGPGSLILNFPLQAGWFSSGFKAFLSPLI